MFRKTKPSEPPEVVALREALCHNQDTKVIIQDKTGNTWILYTDKLRGCSLVLARPKVIERGDDVIVEFDLHAKNGRVE
jgi:hypothetical protein